MVEAGKYVITVEPESPTVMKLDDGTLIRRVSLPQKYVIKELEGLIDSITVPTSFTEEELSRAILSNPYDGDIKRECGYCDGFAVGQADGSAWGYHDGIHEVWDIARRIIANDDNIIEEAFQTTPDNIKSIFEDHNIDEVLDIVNTFEQAKHMTTDFRCGEEVVDEENNLFIVTYVHDDGTFDGVDPTGGVGVHLRISRFKKTGNYYSKLAKMFDAMQEVFNV